MSEKILQNLLDESIASFRSYKKLAESAIEQVTDEEFFKKIDVESNNIAEIIKHIGGNLRSRWTDFLTTDGEKKDRISRRGICRRKRHARKFDRSLGKRLANSVRFARIFNG